MCLEQVQNNPQAAFQFIKLLFVVRKMRVQNKRWSAFQFIKLLFVIRKMRAQNKLRLLLIYSATFVIRKLVCSKQAVGCFLSLFG